MILSVLTRILRRARTLRLACATCEGYGTVSSSWVFGDNFCCTCGAGPLDELTLHDVHCDTVPCPFCQLAREEHPMETRARGGIAEGEQRDALR